MPHFPLGISLNATGIALWWAQDTCSPRVPEVTLPSHALARGSYFSSALMKLTTCVTKSELTLCRAKTDALRLLPPIETEPDVLFGLPNFCTIPLPSLDLAQTITHEHFDYDSDSSTEGSPSRRSSQSPSSWVPTATRGSSPQHSPASVNSKSYAQNDSREVIDEEDYLYDIFKYMSPMWFEDDSRGGYDTKRAEVVTVTGSGKDGCDALDFESPHKKTMIESGERRPTGRCGRKSQKLSGKHRPILQSIPEEDYFYGCLPTNFRTITYTACQSDILSSVFEDDSEDEDEDEDRKIKKVLNWRPKSENSNGKKVLRRRARSQSSIFTSLIPSTSRRSFQN